jgi:hypothetical protein
VTLFFSGAILAAAFVEYCKLGDYRHSKQMKLRGQMESTFMKREK